MTKRIYRRNIRTKEDIQLEEEKIKRFRVKVAEAGSIREFAELKGISISQVNSLFNGTARIKDDLLL